MAVLRDPKPEAAVEIPRRLFHQNLSFLRDRRLQRILALAGHELRLGLPKTGDGIAVWGASPTAWRGEALAAKRGAPLVRIEDAFLRSLRPGRMGDAPIGLMVDPRGVHFDPTDMSAIEHILTTDALDNSNLLQRAKDGYARIRQLDLSKYNIHDPALPPPAPGYVLVVDQTAGDASLRASGATQARFDEMLEAAREAHPHAPIVIKTHPETANGLRPGHYGAQHLAPGVTLLSTPVSPWALLDGAIAVYTVSSQMGFEAILAGHKPHVWGHPFYAGWGLSHDRTPPPRRGRILTRNQLFAGAMILAPIWYDPCRDRLCRFEEALDQLEAETRAFRQDREGYVAGGMRAWKRNRLQAFFGAQKPLIFKASAESAAATAARLNRPLMIWAGAASADLPKPCLRIEDGFLRSRGLGAELVPPLSLVADDLGIYYDPSQPSRLEELLLSPLPPGGRARAEALLEKLRKHAVTKYNLGGEMPDLPSGHRILVPGQVEDDASLRLGGGDIRSNLKLLQATRAANPDAVVLYKPHPDVEAGLRPGAIEPTEAQLYADQILTHTDMAALLPLVDEVWTMTSLTGFEALLRGKKVTTFGAPFYAGWGLTRDLGPVPQRRLRRPDGSLQPRPDLLHLIHAALIAYPRYWDPVSLRPCPPEVALERLANGDIPHPGPLNRLISKVQGRLASHAHLWRRSH
ncbi:capsular polysaccharide biosynthesis protein [Xinfangfangia sp. CPCC 101601]|uniref:Capsular polysaccharide biosynthesis protein n=1 Tax=Pseudogemmobacter lacusdianii TaxID=3069608 RepID=A0ABU0VTB0_9RHOB|nr:capsular polysaccharide biosynthesis protein [Xinfangfangia sp. CPCC 101601]MDQ2064972.1 capsular polysaccharide biosynthesis protein [Xinfangfangia sp. CPCC 101601]